MEQQAAGIQLGTPGNRAELRELQQKGEMGQIWKHVEARTSPAAAELEQSGEEFRRMCRVLHKLHIQEDLLQIYAKEGTRGRWLKLCPLPRRAPIIWEIHGQHHARVSKTISRLQLEWYWPGIHVDANRLLQTCEVCQSAKHGKTAQPQNRQRLTAGRPWQVVSIDLVGPFTRTKRGMR